VRLCHRHEVFGVEEIAHPDLLFKRDAAWLAKFAGEHRLLFVS